MSKIPSLLEGMQGKIDAKVNVPTLGLGSPVLTSKNPLLGQVESTKAPKMLNSAIDYSTRRVVEPCKGITHKVLRAPPTNSANAYQASMGYVRNQPKGLISQQQYPTNLPLMPLASSIYAGQNNPLGQPM